MQKGYSKNISESKISEERVCQSQDSDLQVVETKEGKSEIYLTNYFSRNSVASKNNSVFIHLTEYFDKVF